MNKDKFAGYFWFGLAIVGAIGVFSLGADYYIGALKGGLERDAYRASVAYSKRYSTDGADWICLHKGSKIVGCSLLKVNES